MFISKQSEKFISLLNFWENIGKQEYINKIKEQQVSSKIKNLIEKFQPKNEIKIKQVHSQYLSEKCLTEKYLNKSYLIKNKENKNKENKTYFENYQFSCRIVLLGNNFKKLPNIHNYKEEKILLFNQILKQYICYIFLIKIIKYKKYNLKNYQSLICTNNKKDKKYIINKSEVKENKRRISNGFSCELEEIIVEQIINLIYEEGFKWLITIAPSLLKGIIILNFLSNFF